MNYELRNIFVPLQPMRRLPTLIILLLVLAACTTRGRYDAMRAGLDSINQLNRTDQPFAADDVIPYANYFDRHGTANDRLLAHYLLGRAYHEHGEAPMALQCYQEAADCADTTATDCDYAQLCRVYSQMDAILYQQGLYQEELFEIEQAIKYAKLGKDTLAALFAYEQKGKIFEQLDMKDSFIYVCEQVAASYKRHHYPAYAAIVLGRTIKPLIDAGRYEKAHQILNVYESESGLFDNHHNISNGREIFYYCKGLLFLGYHQTDSAEYYFRKELHDGRDFNNQNAGALGLAQVYQMKNALDSAIKYYQYAYAMNDSMYSQRTTKVIEQARAIHDYSRQQAVARKAERQAAKERSIWQWGGCIAAIIILVVLHVLYRIRAERKKALQQYEQSIEKLKIIEGEIDTARKDIVILSTHKDAAQELIEEKEKRIKFLEAESQRQQQESQQKLDEKTLSLAEETLKKQAEYIGLMTAMNKGIPVTDLQKEQLETLLRVHFPQTYELMTTKRHTLSDDEYLTCLLIRLHISPTQIGLLIEKTGGSITNIRVRLLKKLFGKQGKAIEFDKCICSMC